MTWTEFLLRRPPVSGGGGGEGRAGGGDGVRGECRNGSVGCPRCRVTSWRQESNAAVRLQVFIRLAPRVPSAVSRWGCRRQSARLPCCGVWCSIVCASGHPAHRWCTVERTRGARAKVLRQEGERRKGRTHLVSLCRDARRWWYTARGGGCSKRDSNPRSCPGSHSGHVRECSERSRRAIKKRDAPIMTRRSRLAQAHFIVTIVSPLKEAHSF